MVGSRDASRLRERLLEQELRDLRLTESGLVLRLTAGSPDGYHQLRIVQAEIVDTERRLRSVRGALRDR